MTPHLHLLLPSSLAMRKLATSTSSTPPHTTTGEILKVKRTRKSVPRNLPTQRSSVYRGVTRHRWTGRFEAHLWDKSCWSESQKKKGKQVYLGAYNDEGAAAKAYDLAALKYWGRETILKFPLLNYENKLKEMEGRSKEEYISSLRRKSSGFSRGVSKYRGVARHHHNGRWEARIGRVLGNKYLYLGTYATQEEAAIAYDMAAIEHQGLSAITNFDVSRYLKYLQHSDDSDQESKANSQTANQMPQDEDTNKVNTLLQEEWFGAQLPVYSIASYPHARIEEGQAVPSEFGIAVDQSSKFEHIQEKISYWDDYRRSQPELSPLDDHLQSFCSFPGDIQTCFHSAVYENYTYADDIFSGDLEAISNVNFEFDQVFPYIFEFD